MKIHKQTLFIILILFGQLFAQNCVLRSRPLSKEYVNFYNKLSNITINDWKNISLSEKKEIASITLKARIKNPLEVFNVQKNNNEKDRINYRLADNLFFESELFNIKDKSNKRNNLIYDVYWGPFVIIGHIKNVEILKRIKDPENGHDEAIIYRYSMIIDENLNTYADLSEGDTVNFLHSTGHRIWYDESDLIKNKFIIGEQYLVFLSDTPSQYGIQKIDHFLNLRITRKGDEGFKIINNQIADPNNYFTVAAIADKKVVISKIKSTIDEIINWGGK